MLQLILVVAILISLAYWWNRGKTSENPNSFGRTDDPFKGRHKNPPPRTGYHTIDKGAMTRCHNCSCFFPEGQVVQDVVEGHVLEFCSESCKRNFLAPRHG